MAKNNEIKLASFKFLKQSVERNEDYKGDLKISPHINISDINEFKPEGTKQESLKIDFKFEIDYNGMGKVVLKGRMFLVMDNKLVKETVKAWKDKKLDNDMNLLILNIIMRKSSIKALQLEDEIGLPAHMQLPMLQLDKK